MIFSDAFYTGHHHYFSDVAKFVPFLNSLTLLHRYSCTIHFTPTPTPTQTYSPTSSPTSTVRADYIPAHTDCNKSPTLVHCLLVQRVRWTEVSPRGTTELNDYSEPQWLAGMMKLLQTCPLSISGRLPIRYI